MATAVEILLKAKNETDAAFKAILDSLKKTEEQSKKTGGAWTEQNQRMAMAMSRTHDEALKLNAALSAAKTKQWTDDQQAAAMAMSRLHSEALKMNAALADQKAKMDQSHAQALKMNEAFDAQSSLANKLAGAWPAIAAGLTALAAAAMAAGKAVADATLKAAAYGDKLAGLADKTGLSTKALQSLEVAAKLGNSSIEAVASGVNKMQQGLVSGSEAFAKLGLNIQQLRELSPEEQFKAVATAIESIEDPAERAAARMAVFGKSGNDLAGTLKAAAEGAGELGGALSDEALSASAELQDQVDLLATAWDRVILQFGAAVAQSPELQKALAGITEALVKLAEGVAKAAPMIATFFDTITRGAKIAFAVFETETRIRMGDGFQAIKDFKDKVEQIQLDSMFNDVEGAASTTAKKIVSGFGEATGSVKAAAGATKELKQEFEAAGPPLDQIVQNFGKSLPILTHAAGTIGKDFLSAIPPVKSVFVEVKKGTDEAVKGGTDWSKTLANVANSFELLGGTAGKTLAQIAGGIASVKAHIQTMSAPGAGILDKVVGGLGIASTALSIGKKIFDGLFGGAKKAREEMEKLRNEFIKGQGGMAALTIRAKEAGIALDAMFRAKSAGQLQAAITGIQKQLDLWAEGQNAITEAMEKYGISVTEMGPKFAQQELDKQAAEVAKAFAVLAAAGGDVSMIAVKMGDDVIALVNQYKAAGVAIPEALRPVLEAMLKNGQLVDENGQAYGSLEEAGIKFAESMTDAMNGLMSHIEELVKVLARGFNVPVNFSYNNAPGGGPAPPKGEVPEFATGGVGNFGSGSPAMLHGTEAVLPLDNRTMAMLGDHIAAAMSRHGGGGSSGPIIVQTHLNGRQIDTYMTDRMRQRGIKTASQQRGRRV